MEQRKLIRLGNSSFAIALPKNWIEKSGLKKGENIFIQQNSNGELIVSSEFKKINGEKRIDIDLGNKDIYSLNKEVAAAYVKGYDLIYFTGKRDRRKIEEIKEITKSMISIEIVDNNEEFTIAKDFFNFNEINQANFIKRIDNNIKEMFSLLIEAIKNKNFSQHKIKEIEEIDKDINKFYLLHSRLMFKGLDNPSILSTLRLNSVELFNNWWVCFNLESIGDSLKSILFVLKNSKIDNKQVNLIVSLVSEIQKIYNKTMESVYKGDKEIAIEVSKEMQKILNECEKVLKSNENVLIQITDKLKEIESACYQNAKIILYLKI